MTRGDNTYTYANDGQGSIRQLTNASGEISDQYWYTAFGEELANTGTTENSFRYVGETFDPNCGFYYNRARWYDQGTGRFTSVDPFSGDEETPNTLHKYNYVNASAPNFIDPSGQFTLEMLSISSIMGILAAQAVVTPGIGKKFLFVVNMVDYYDNGPDHRPNTADDLGIVPFPGFYSGLLNNIFDELKKSSSKVEIINSQGSRGWLAKMKLANYSAIISHGSKKQPYIFSSLFEIDLARNADGSVDMDQVSSKISYNTLQSNAGGGAYIAACHAARWTSDYSKLAAESMTSTPIEDLLKAAKNKLLTKMKQ